MTRKDYLTLADALRALPDDVDMIEDNYFEGRRYFCCGGEVRRAGLHGFTGKHERDCWYTAARAALAEYDA